MPFTFGTINLTTCGATGPVGPALAACTSAYAPAPWVAQLLNMNTSGIQSITLPVSGTYKLLVAGAMGGSVPDAQGGGGRVITATFNFTMGDVLQVLVGQSGLSMLQANNRYAGGGGGGTFVVDSQNAAVLVAGGGGGAANSAIYGVFAGVSAAILNSSDGVSGTNGGAVGGSAGAGGSGNYHGSGGGGFYGSGVASGNPAGGGPATAFVSGGQGGSLGGGFGGGAGAGSDRSYVAAGGGGGGFSGGGAGAMQGGGGGGGNYVRANAQTAVDGGTNFGDGFISVTFLL